mmetsp:Transcript_90463/g.251462  ORF Transcript_90463/g.251462 Transcript_90463/m.251462 type:complete len:324 (+) Transcript_90463:448-1419(+)
MRHTSIVSTHMRAHMKANLFSPWLASRQYMGWSRLKHAREYTETSSAMDTWAFSSTVGIHGGLWKITASNNPRKRAANSMIPTNSIRSVIRRHHWTNPRWKTDLKCMQKPGCTRRMSLVTGLPLPGLPPFLDRPPPFSTRRSSSLPLSEPALSSSSSSKSSSQAAPLRLSLQKRSRYSTNSSCVTTSASGLSVACSMSSSTMPEKSALSVSSKPWQHCRNSVKASSSSGPPSCASFSHSSLTLRLITSWLSLSKGTRPRAGNPWLLTCTASALFSLHFSKSLSGRLFVGRSGFSTVMFWPERMSIIQSAGFSFSGIWKPRRSR